MQRKAFGWRAAVTVAAVLSTLVPSAVFAAFTAPINISQAGGDPGRGQVAVKTDGAMVIVWGRSDGTSTRIYARLRSSVGSLGAILPLSPAGRESFSPRVTVDGSGNAYVIWNSTDGALFRIEGRSITPAGAVGALQVLSGGTPLALGPSLATNAAGDSIIGWVDFISDTSSRVQARTRSAGGALGSIKNLNNPQDTSVASVDVAIDADGDALVGWTEIDQAAVINGQRVRVRPITSAGVLGAPAFVSAPSPNIPLSQLTMDSGGNAVVAWGRAASASIVVQTRSRSAAGALGPISTQSPPIASLGWIDVAASAGGVTHLIWGDLDDASVRARVAPAGTAGGPFGPTHRVSPAADAASVPDLAVDGFGDARITWYVAARRDVRTRVHTAAGALQPVETVSTDADVTQFSTPQVAVNAGGAAGIVWFRNPAGPDNDRVQLAVSP